MHSLFQALPPVTTSTSPTEPPVELAGLPLQFGYKEQCENQTTMDRIAEVLSSQCGSDEVMAAIFINAQQGHYQPALNQLIRTLDGKHGSGTVVVNPHVREILRARDIALTTGEQGTVQMRLDIPLDIDTDRVHAIDESLGRILTPEMMNIVTSYDAEILFEISQMYTWIEIFRSGDPTQKNQIIDAADEPYKVNCLDLLFADILKMDGAVNLTGVDLSKLARQPLKIYFPYAYTRPTTMQLFIDVMADDSRDKRSDRRSGNQVTAQFLKTAFDHDYQTELNDVIKATASQRGLGAILIHDDIKRILAEKDIELIQHDDGTIAMHGACAVTDDDDGPERRTEEIDRSLHMLPSELTKIVGQYDRALKICKKNETVIIDMLNSTDQAAKSELFAAASHQNQIRYFNSILNKIRSPDKLLDLSDVDLSGLNLSFIDLCQTNLHRANMRDTVLAHAELTSSTLHCANLDGAIFVGAELADAQLTGASAIGANFNGASLSAANLSGAKLHCATFISANLNGVNSSGAYLGLNDLTGAMHVDDFLKMAHMTVDESGTSLTFLPSNQTGEG